jgi:hypothetical protein
MTYLCSLNVYWLIVCTISSNELKKTFGMNDFKLKQCKKFCTTIGGVTGHQQLKQTLRAQVNHQFFVGLKIQIKQNFNYQQKEADVIIRKSSTS